jgi:hypothetical protein
MTIIQFEIKCGEESCAREEGKFCRFLGSRKFGSVSVCLLFPSKNPGRKESGASTSLEEKNGWVLRCLACLDAETSGCTRFHPEGREFGVP